MFTFILILIAWAVTIVTLLIGAWICYALMTNKVQSAPAPNATTVTNVAVPVVAPATAQAAAIAANQAASSAPVVQ